VGLADISLAPSGVVAESVKLGKYGIPDNAVKGGTKSNLRTRTVGFSPIPDLSYLRPGTWLILSLRTTYFSFLLFRFGLLSA
jgi:hypothetical protein